MKKITVIRGSKISEVLLVSGRELKELSEKFSSVSISEHDLNTVDFSSEDYVGVLAGDIDSLREPPEGFGRQVQNPDIWFINKEFFEKNYINLDYPETRFDFGTAIHLLKAGYKVAREGWNGKNMFLFLVPGSTFKVNRPPLLGIYPEGTEVNYQPHIDMKTSQDTVVPWLASQSDVLAEDFVLVK